MKNNNMLRHIVIATFLSLGVLWSFSSAAEKEAGYLNDQFVTTAQWLKTHKDDKNVVVVNERTDDHFDGSLIHGAVHMPWSLFRHNDIGENLAETFVGVSAGVEDSWRTTGLLPEIRWALS